MFSEKISPRSLINLIRRERMVVPTTFLKIAIPHTMTYFIIGKNRERYFSIRLIFTSEEQP